MRHSYRPAIPPPPQLYRTQILDYLGLVAEVFEELGCNFPAEVAFRVEPVVTQPAPPQIRTGAMNSYGASVPRGSAPLWRIPLLPRQTSSESVNDLGSGQDEPLSQ